MLYGVMSNSDLQFRDVTGNVTIQQAGGDIVTGNKTITQKITNFILGDRAQVDLRNRQIILARVRQFWIEGVLEKSLHHEMLLQLGKQEAADAVSHPWDVQIQEVAERPPQDFSRDQSMLAIFENLGRALLILGAPGSGKTITLLELARDAIVRAEDDPLQPIPVVLNLSSWAERRQSLAAWIVAELNLKYQIPKNVGQQWLEQNEIMLLLDGLDEVASEQRSACVDALNQFRQEHGLSGMAVCSRLEEYHAMTTQLALTGAVVIQPLSTEQMARYLASGPELAALQTAWQEDRVLQELAESPLMLNVMTLAYQGVPVEELRSTEALETRRNHLFATYIERMLKRRGADPRYTPQQTKHWLAWLAGKMAQHFQTEFFIEGLQPTWLATTTQRLLYDVGIRAIGGITFVFTMLLAAVIFHGLAAVDALMAGRVTDLLPAILYNPFGLQQNFPGLKTTPGLLFIAIVVIAVILGVAFELASMFAIKLPKWLAIVITIGMVAILSSLVLRARGSINWAGGIGAGLMCGLPGGWAGVSLGERNRIPIVEKIAWSWRKSLRGGIVGATLEVFLALIFQLILKHSESFANVTISEFLGTGLFLVLALIVIFGLSRSEVPETRTFPNQGIWRSASNAFRVGCLVLVASILFVVAFAVSDPKDSLLFGLAVGIFMGLLSGTVFGLAVGGAACIQYAVLRFILVHNGDIPRHIVNFLEYAVERIFLRKVGGGYLFPHRMLLEHFATLEETNIKGG